MSTTDIDDTPPLISLHNIAESEIQVEVSHAEPAKRLDKAIVGSNLSKPCPYIVIDAVG